MPGFEVGGYRLIVNTRDERGHRPHVHVVKGRGKVKILLDADLTPYEAKSLTRPEIARARELVGANFCRLRALWEKYNG